MLGPNIPFIYWLGDGQTVWRIQVLGSCRQWFPEPLQQLSSHPQNNTSAWVVGMHACETKGKEHQLESKCLLGRPGGYRWLSIWLSVSAQVVTSGS